MVEKHVSFMQTEYREDAAAVTKKGKNNLMNSLTIKGLLVYKAEKAKKQSQKYL